MIGTDSTKHAIGLRVVSGIFMAGMYICVKAISEDVPIGEIVFFRSAFAIPPLIIFLWLRCEFPQGMATKRPIGHLLRASFGAMALFASFASLTRLNVAEAMLIAQLSPILMTIAAVFLLRERLTLRRLTGLFFGLTGVIVLVWPEIGKSQTSDVRLFGYGLALLSATLSALALIMVRRLNTTESPGAIAFYFMLASMFGAVLTIPFGWLLPSGLTLLLLICAGLFGGLAHIALTLAFRYAEVSRLAPFEYIALLWPFLADLFIFEAPLLSGFLLALPLILLGGIVAVRER